MGGTSGEFAGLRDVAEVGGTFADISFAWMIDSQATGRHGRRAYTQSR